jgi:hypothetical protein
MVKTHNINSLYFVFGTVANDTLYYAAIRFWRRHLSPFGLACFARWLRYRGSTHTRVRRRPCCLASAQITLRE